MINELISWIKNPDNSSVVMAISTFALTIATFVLAYFSYQQVKASNRAISESRLQKKIEMHNEDLRQKYYQTLQEIIDKISPLISSMQKEIEGCNFDPRSVYLKAIE
jgi:uncharacterized FlaG/YvyC family protein